MMTVLVKVMTVAFLMMLGEESQGRSPRQEPEPGTKEEAIHWTSLLVSSLACSQAQA